MENPTPIIKYHDVSAAFGCPKPPDNPLDIRGVLIMASLPAPGDGIYSAILQSIQEPIYAVAGGTVDKNRPYLFNTLCVITSAGRAHAFTWGSRSQTPGIKQWTANPALFFLGCESGPSLPGLEELFLRGSLVPLHHNGFHYYVANTRN